MKMLVHTKVGRRFLVTSILIFLPIAAAGFLGIKIAMDALRTQTHALLRTASDGAEAQVREFLVSLERTTESRAEEEAIKLPLLHPNQSNRDLGERLTHLQMRVPEAKEIFCLNMEGKVVASSTPAMLGKDLSSSTEFLHGQKAFEPGDILRDPGTSAIYWRMSAPVRNSQTGQLLGVVVVGFDPAALSVLTAGKRALAQGAGTQSFRMGESGETYIVNKDGLLLTESRFAPGSALALKAKTAPVRAAIERGEEIIADYKDYRGVEVIGASAILADRGWVLMSEIDFSQASAPIRALRPLLLTITVLTLLMAGLIARAFSKSILTPLLLTAEADRALATGDEKSAIVSETQLPSDEIGHFIRNRNAKVKAMFKHERELLNEQQHRAEVAAALEGLSYSMVHDMRAPLRAITTFGDLIGHQASGRLTAAEKDYLARMRSASLRMDHLICDMLRYSSLLNKEVPLCPVNVPELVRGVINDNPVLRTRRTDIEIQREMPLVKANPAVLAQCFSVLLDNALRYARPEIAAKVNVSAESGEGRVRLVVADNGIGISQHLQDKLFRPFHRGTNVPGGTGIGLALVRAAMERMDGHAGVHSEEGKGSRFWLELKQADRLQESRIP